jgi:hypothetical protein
MEAMMKANSMIVMAAALALSASGLSAQAQGQAPGEPVVQSKINLTLEQRHMIKEIIKDIRIQPAPANIETAVGATVPESVSLSPMPTAVSEKVPQIKSHLFFLKDGKVVVVDPKDHKIIDAID